jgi:hypothetical protein
VLFTDRLPTQVSEIRLFALLLTDGCGIPKGGALHQRRVLAHSHERYHWRPRGTYDLVAALPDLDMADFAHSDVKATMSSNGLLVVDGDVSKRTGHESERRSKGLHDWRDGDLLT